MLWNCFHSTKVSIVGCFVVQEILNVRKEQILVGGWGRQTGRVEMEKQSQTKNIMTLIFKVNWDISTYIMLNQWRNENSESKIIKIQQLSVRYSLFWLKKHKWTSNTIWQKPVELLTYIRSLARVLLLFFFFFKQLSPDFRLWSTSGSWDHFKKWNMKH